MTQFFITDNEGKLEKRDTFTPKCWVDMINPSDDECEKAAEFCGVPEDMIKAALDEEERARTEFDDGCSLFLVDCPIINEEDGVDVYDTLPLAVIYNNNCVITVCLKGNTVLKEFIVGRTKVYTQKPVHFMLTFLLGNAKRYLYCLKQIDRKNHRIQSEMGRTMRNSEIVQLLDLQNSLVYFSTSLGSNTRVYEKLSKVEGVATSEEYQDLYDDVLIESRQALETCNIYKNILSVTMDAYGSVISNNANGTMRKLTIITILLAIPTMIAGFWGMNMPVPGEGSGNTLWFWLVIAGTFLLTLAVAFIVTQMGMYSPRRQRKRRRRKKRDGEM